MNIQALAKKAIDKINAMNIDELEGMFAKYGYNPVRRENNTNFPNISQTQVLVIDAAVQYPTIHKIEAVNQPVYFNATSGHLDRAA